MPVESAKNHINILLTGGSGFIGKNIVESFLANKYHIIAPAHKNLDLMDEHKVRDFFKENNIDIVIHSACKPGHRNAKDPTNILYSNTRMFFNLVHNSTLYKKMIVIGSGAVYDMRYYRPKMKEDYFGFHVPVDEHGFGRYVCARYIEQVDNIIELRIFGIFGKYEDYAIRFISNT
ncbi:MAG: NAD-dependent epimerase/dehydratase family protein, partial [Candidatus Eremiobacterota bacterium]